MNRLLVLGTHNRKKGEELARLVRPIGFQVLTLADYPRALNVVEDGSTFGENARLKACQQAVHLKTWVLGEDSGLRVDALDGRPGLFSARFSGPSATDAANNARLLQELDGIPAERRSAHYVCHMTLADPTGVVRAEAEDCCHGRIAPAPRGTAGFGYDPLFEIVEYHRTFGELGDAVKSLLSHRGRAARQMLSQLIRLACQEAWT
jgi:XTP/dITP diphosphohydrolase